MRNKISDILLKIGIFYKQKGNLQKALKPWKLAHLLSKNNPEVKLFLLSALWESEDKPSGLSKKLIDLLKPNPNDFIVYGPNLDPEKINNGLQKYGLVHIKGAIPAGIVNLWKQNLETNINYISGHAGFNSECSHTLPSYFINRQNDKAKFIAGYKNGIEKGNPHKLEHWTTENKEFFTKLLKVFEDNRVLDAISKYLKKPKDNLTLYPDYSMARSIMPAESHSVGYHQDGRLQNRKDLFATLWIPFDKCGPGFAPSLSIIPVRLNNHFPADKSSRNYAKNSLPEEIYYQPIFDAGDILLHSTYTMHRTYMDKEMQHKRTSVDLRIF